MVAVARPLSAPAAVSLDEVTAGGCLEGFGLSVGQGERICLMGANGTGKTTLLRLVAGLLATERGRVRVGGPVGMVAQDHAASLLPWLRVRDNVALPLRPLRLPRLEVERRVAEALQWVPIPAALLGRYPYQLSGGEQQRVALARALVGTPRTLLLDEPFSALDAAGRIEARAALTTWARRGGVTVLLVSHDLDDARQLAERVLLLDGRPARVVAELAAATLDGETLRAALRRGDGR